MPRFKIRVKIGPVLRMIRAEKRYWERNKPKLLRQAGQIGVRILKENVPKGATRQLEENCSFEIKGDTVHISTYGLDEQGVDYAPIVDSGTSSPGRTASSPGRFIPHFGGRGISFAAGMGRRLVNPSKHNPDIGMHPGSFRWPFFHFAARDTKVEVTDLFRQMARGKAR